MGLKKHLIRVAVAGRRNVGKSTLFNALLGRNRAITDAYSGLTRDVLTAHVKRGTHSFEISDTPGLDLENEGELETAILDRTRVHLAEVQLVLLLLEAPSLHGFDHFLIDFFRHSTKAKIIYVVNKVDNPKKADEALAEFYEAGLDPVIPICARGRWNLVGLLDEMAKTEPRILKRQEGEGTEIEHPAGDVIQATHDFSMAIVGRPNSGKSSIFNRLIEKDVSLVSEIPGTTRDTVDTIFHFFGRAVKVIDTAGLRRASHLRGEENRVDFFSAARTRRAIKAADICVHVIDAAEGITDLDKKITDFIVDAKKPVILAINKWDLIADKTQSTMKEYLDRLRFLFPHASKFPTIFCSALTSQRVKKILDEACALGEKIHFRVPTHELNKLVAGWNRALPGGFTGKILYVTQAEEPPPQFIFFISKKDRMRGSFVSYFENRLRDKFDLDGIPIRIELRGKGQAG